MPRLENEKHIYAIRVNNIIKIYYLFIHYLIALVSMSSKTEVLHNLYTINLTHFEKECEVTVYVMRGKVETHKFHKTWRKALANIKDMVETTRYDINSNFQVD